MQTYRRFVSYVYQYENGKKAGNRGFIKVEAKGNTCNIQISLKGICKDENTACSVYGFKREDGLLKGSLLAECPVKAGVVREHLVLPRNEMGRAKYGLQELNGIIFQGNDKTMYGTQWDDDPMKMENFQPDERNEELTDSGSGFAEEKAEGWQNTSETPAGEWLTDSERIPEEMAVEREPLVETPENSTLAEPQWEDRSADSMAEDMQPAAEWEMRDRQEELLEEIIPDRTEMQDAPEKMPVQTKPEDGMDSGTEVQNVEQNVPEIVLPGGPGPHNEPDAVLPGEPGSHSEPDAVLPGEPRVQNGPDAVLPGGAEMQQTMPDAALPDAAGTQTMPETALPDAAGTQTMSEAALIDERERQDMPETALPDETEKNMPGETGQEEAIPDGLGIQIMPEETEPEETRQGMMEQGNMHEETKMEEFMPDGIEMPDIPGGLQEEHLADGRIYGQEGAEVELTKILDTTIPVQELPEMDAPLVQAAENLEKRQDQGNYIKQEPKNSCPFSDGVLEDCRKIKIGDLRFLDSRDQNLRNNRFVQHGYQMFGHLLLARIARNGQHILGVPGMYQQQEKFMADMFGFHNFKYAKKNGSKPSSFGYWYRLIYPPKHGRGNSRAK